MSAETPAAEPTLRWIRGDAYHVRTECGRFSVARRTVKGIDWYIAYRLEGNGKLYARELGAAQVSPRSTDAERSAVIRDLKALCEAAT